MRIVVDEHISRAAVDGLTRLGHDVVTLADVGRSGRADEAQLDWAMSEHRMFVTNDDDYLRLAYQGREHAGVAYCHIRKYRGRVGQLITAIATAIEGHTQESTRNAVHFL